MDFQVIKIDLIDEIVLVKARLGALLKFQNISVQPDGSAKVEPHTGFLQRREYLVRPGLIAVIFNCLGFDQMCIFNDLKPDSHNLLFPLLRLCLLHSYIKSPAEIAALSDST
jgi:hypothetical protein